MKNQSKILKKYMKKALSLAKRGEGQVSPNPLVGAVVLDKNGNLAGIGWHKKYGEAHAEPNAIKNAEENGFNIEGGTIIVSLEPCSHYGKTPPCADLIIQKGFKKAVIGCVDPNPKVSGKGLNRLQKAGIEVIQNVMENECKKINEIFIKNQTTQLPFIAIKTATTTDGKIATKTGSSKWITSEKSRKYVQKLRNKYDAILTGSRTVICDNPSLTCRMKKGRNPVRIIIDSNAITPPESKVFHNDGTKVILAVSQNADTSKYSKHIEIVKCPINKTTGKIDLNFLVKKLFEKGIYSILVEAGGTLNGAFIQEALCDKIYQFIAPKIAGDSKAKGFVENFDIKNINECVNLITENIRKFNPDLLIEYKVNYSRKSPLTTL